MIIKILGTGCTGCNRAKDVALKAVQDLGIDAEVQDVTDISVIMGYGVMTTPAIVINEKLVGYGGVPTPKQMANLIEQFV